MLDAHQAQALAGRRRHVDRELGLLRLAGTGCCGGRVLHDLGGVLGSGLAVPPRAISSDAGFLAMLFSFHAVLSAHCSSSRTSAAALLLVSRSVTPCPVASASMWSARIASGVFATAPESCRTRKHRSCGSSGPADTD